MKKMRVLAKVSLLALTFLVWSSTVFSQSKMPVKSLTTDWSLFQEVKGVKFYAKKEIHTNEGPKDVDYIVIKLENTSNNDLTATYSLAVHFDSWCNGCNSAEYMKTITIPANSSIEGDSSKGRSPLFNSLTNHNSTNIARYITTENLIIK